MNVCIDIIYGIIKYDFLYYIIRYIYSYSGVA